MSVEKICECLIGIHSSGSKIIYAKTLEFEREFLIICSKNEGSELIEKLKKFNERIRNFLQKLDELKEI